MSIETHAGGKRPWGLFFIVLTILSLGVLVIVFRPVPKPPIEAEMVVTVADLSPIHSTVRVGKEEVRALSRLALGDVVETDAGGRARLRLDNGTGAVLDGSTKIEITKEGFKVLAGRVFVDAKELPTTVDLEVGSIAAVGSTLFVDRRKNTTAYVGSGEVTARGGGKESAVTTGDSVDFEGGLKVRPERGFDDWTAGLAAPWSANGPLRRTVGELWGRAEPGHVGSPLTIRSQEVTASILGEMAQTTVRTTFFNAGEIAVLGDYRTGLPEGAIVSGFRTKRGDRWKTGNIALASRTQVMTFEQGLTAAGDILEWAGDGWVRGTLSRIPPGQVVVVEVSYVEWLRAKPGESTHQVQYRYPLVGDGPPPLVGDFTISVDAGPAEATKVAAGMGASIDESKVVLKRSDFRATADFVVDVEIPKALPKARAFVVDADEEDEEATFVVRTEAPRLEGTEEGVTLSVVIDTSASVDPSLLAAGQAFVEALLNSLGGKDRIVVLSADTQTTPIGPAEMGVLDDARRAAIKNGLASLTPAGATDLGRAMEAAANALPKDAPSGMVVYVGDGWPSVGDRTSEAIMSRLARRKAGVPRLGAVLVGPSGNRRLFADVTKGSGFLTEVADSEDAARASVDLLGRAIVPTVTGVRLDLGPNVARIYPRTEIAVTQGHTTMVVGKLLGPAPKSLVLTYRQGEAVKTEKRAITLQEIEDKGDLDRRWAEARASSMALVGRGREAVTEAALKARLLTPWTLYTTEGAAETASTPLETRVLDLGTSGSAFGVSVANDEGASYRSFSSEEDALTGWPEPSLEQALVFATVRTLDDARGQMKACRDSRAALRPDLPPAIEIRLTIDGEGKPKDIAINNAGDDALARCVMTVVENLQYPKLYEKVEATVSHTVTWPITETLRGKKCSPTSTLTVPLRRGVWRERFDRQEGFAAYLEAKRGCELESWTAKRAFLELMLTWFERKGSVSLSALDLAKKLGDVAEDEAANFLRKEAVRRGSPTELKEIRRRLLVQERLPMAAFLAKYEKAATDADRLAVVRTFFPLAPHDRRLRELLLTLLLTTDQKDALGEEIRKLRVDPFADAGLIAHAAHLERRMGNDAAAKRTYGEIAERATHDPWALAFVGDRLRGEGWFDEAAFAYEGLLALVPEDGPAELRLALAHAGAGRIDVALRSLGTVARTGGRDGAGETGMLAERAAAVLVRETIAKESTTADQRKGLVRALAEMTALPQGVPFLVQPPPGRAAPRAWIERGADKEREFIAPEALLGRVGLLAIRLEPGKEGESVLVLTRDKELPPSEPYVVKLTALVGDRAISVDVTLPNTGERVEVPWTGAFGDPRTVKAPEPK